MTFLPDNYEKPESNSRYFRFKQGNNIFRVLSEAITGWEDWTPEKKPVRTKTKPEHPIVQGKYPKHFWAFVVFDYADTSIKILQITQAGIQDQMYNLHTSKEWGDPRNYDINIRRTGESLETKYNVMPSPPSVINPEITEAYSKENINLEKLFDNGDPFEASQEQAEPAEGSPDHPQYAPAPTQDEQLEQAVENIPF